MTVLLGGSAEVAGEKVGGEVVFEMVAVIFVPIVVEVQQLEPCHTPVVLAELARETSRAANPWHPPGVSP